VQSGNLKQEKSCTIIIRVEVAKFCTKLLVENRGATYTQVCNLRLFIKTLYLFLSQILG